MRTTILLLLVLESVFADISSARSQVLLQVTQGNNDDDMDEDQGPHMGPVEYQTVVPPPIRQAERHTDTNDPVDQPRSFPMGFPRNNAAASMFTPPNVDQSPKSNLVSFPQSYSTYSYSSSAPVMTEMIALRSQQNQPPPPPPQQQQAKDPGAPFWYIGSFLFSWMFWLWFPCGIPPLVLLLDSIMGKSQKKWEDIQEQHKPGKEKQGKDYDLIEVGTAIQYYLLRFRQIICRTWYPKYFLYSADETTFNFKDPPENKVVRLIIGFSMFLIGFAALA
eukprot:c1884_g1_i1.p1 GENE.c1884_g1_i1~~c1884_g1_i1.p1  ORF type:complete len:277 (-),score=59.05 c1884_g1_i1:17-847(-)